MKRKTPGLQDAIADLASLFEYGTLLADTMPAEFMKTVAAEVRRLREVAHPRIAG